jgi:hypothetical protein
MNLRPTTIIILALATAACSSSSGSGGPASSGDAGPTSALVCAPDRAATPYTAQATASVVTSSSESGAPYPCLSLTGFGTSESSLGIASDGTLFVAPAYTDAGNGVARSADQGATWQALVPTADAGGVHGRVQPFFYLDPSTNRMFFATSHSGGGFDLSWSSDLGASWNQELISTDAQDWIKIFAGPAATTAPTGYPNVLYTSAPSPISTPSDGLTAAPNHQTIYKSLDGGVTWQSVGGSSLTLNPSDEVDAGLATSTVCPSTEWVIFGDGVVGSDGTVYIGYRMCTELAVAISKDEGTTWTSVVVPGSVLPTFSSPLSPLSTQNLLASEPIAVDSSGNIYAVWNDATGLVHLSVSMDQGSTWSSAGAGGALVASAPGVKQTVLSAVGVKAPGTITIAYFGSTDGKAFSGYVAESTNALVATPTFWSTTVNDPSEPFFADGFDNNYKASLSGGDLDEFVQVKYAPSGDVWVSFLKEMCPGGVNSSNCTWDYATHANSVFQGAVGRLVHPAGGGSGG